jgi:hypothetical protein
VRVSSGRAGLGVTGVDRVGWLRGGNTNGVGLCMTFLSNGDDFCGVTGNGSASGDFEINSLSDRSRAVVRDRNNRDGSASGVDRLGGVRGSLGSASRVDRLGGVRGSLGSASRVYRLRSIGGRGLGSLGVGWGSTDGVDGRNRSWARLSIASVNGRCQGLRVVGRSQVGRVDRVVTALANGCGARNPGVRGLGVCGRNILGRSDFVLGRHRSGGSVSLRVAAVLARSYSDNAGCLGGNDLSAVCLGDRANRGGRVSSVLRGRGLHGVSSAVRGCGSWVRDGGSGAVGRD